MTQEPSTFAEMLRGWAPVLGPVLAVGALIGLAVGWLLWA